MGAEEDVSAFLQAQALVDVTGLYLGEVAVQDLGHGAAGDVGALLGQARVGQVAAGVLADFKPLCRHQHPLPHLHPQRTASNDPLCE